MSIFQGRECCIHPLGMETALTLRTSEEVEEDESRDLADLQEGVPDLSHPEREVDRDDRRFHGLARGAENEPLRVMPDQPYDGIPSDGDVGLEDGQKETSGLWLGEFTKWTPYWMEVPSGTIRRVRCPWWMPGSQSLEQGGWNVVCRKAGLPPWKRL